MVEIVLQLSEEIFFLSQIPIEAERLVDDLVLEQYLSPTSPQLAGFRLDGFSAIKPRVMHSPSSDLNIWDKSSAFMDDRFISPAVLYIQVSAFQVNTKIREMLLSFLVLFTRHMHIQLLVKILINNIGI